MEMGSDLSENRSCLDEPYINKNVLHYKTLTPNPNLCLVLPVNGSSREMERCDPNPDPKQVTGELMGVS